MTMFCEWWAASTASSPMFFPAQGSEPHNDACGDASRSSGSVLPLATTQQAVPVASLKLSASGGGVTQGIAGAVSSRQLPVDQWLTDEVPNLRRSKVADRRGAQPAAIRDAWC